MLGVSKKSQEPTTYFALAFFTCMVAFVILLIGIFTPNWSQVTEQVGTSLTTTVYDKGLIVSCFANQGCSGITEFSKLSGIFLASFILGIIAVVCGFFVIQIFCAGLFIRSCKETNLGVPIAALAIIEGALLMLVLVLFEISVSLDTLPGNIHRNDTFGFSRGLIIGAIVLYFVAALFIVGEDVRRKSGLYEPPNSSKDTKHRSHHHRSNRDEHRNRGRRPPPYQ